MEKKRTKCSTCKCRWKRMSVMQCRKNWRYFIVCLCEYRMYILATNRNAFCIRNLLERMHHTNDDVATESHIQNCASEEKTECIYKSEISLFPMINNIRQFSSFCLLCVFCQRFCYHCLYFCLLESKDQFPKLPNLYFNFLACVALA